MHIDSVSKALVSVDFVDEISLAKAPEPLPRPAAPVITDTFVPDDVTIATTTWNANPPDVPSSPAPVAAVSDGDLPAFVPFTVAPTLRNRDEVVDAMVVNSRIGDGHVVSFAIRPFWRWQTQGTFLLGFNAILSWNDLDADGSAVERSRTGANRTTEPIRARERREARLRAMD
jgi:hypothetical protein